MTALEYSFSVSDSESYKWYIEDLKKFLKPYDLEEQKNLTVCPDGTLFKQKGPVCVSFLSPYFVHAVVVVMLSLGTPKDTLGFL